MDISRKPHDTFFRSFFSHVDTMQELLDQVLPPELLSDIDRKSLQIDSQSYIDEKGREWFSDIAASVNISGKTQRVYLLFEHKSSYDAMVHLQILNYMQQTWRRDVGSKKGSRVKLCPILPILFYHGPNRSIDPGFHSLLSAAMNKTNQRHQPDFDLIVYNLSQLSDARIGGTIDVQAALLSLKHARDNLSHLLAQLNRLANQGDVLLVHNPRFRQIELYILSAAGLTNRELQEKIQAEVTNPVLQEAFMSTAQLLIQEGLEIGLEKGIRTGRQEEALLVAGRLKELGMSLEQIAGIVDLPLDELTALLAANPDD